MRKTLVAVGVVLLASACDVTDIVTSGGRVGDQSETVRKIGTQLGVISFPNSGGAAAQEPFFRGMLLLHSFEYDDAAAAFRDAQAVDSSFGLAYWGEALTHYRPVWGRENLDEGRSALEQAPGGSSVTPREQAYLDAAAILFGDGERERRWRRYSDAMGQVSRDYPEDQEAASLYAVSMFGVTDGERDHRTYMKIASIGEGVFRRNPNHPGALHYLIHAFDDPVHAPLGLRYAHLYSKVASAAPHAQHMPSHIFLALGMWDECISSNLDSWNSSEDRIARLGVGSDDRGYHALWWMQYAYLQKGMLAKAREKLSIVEQDAAQADSSRARNHQAYMRAHLLIDGEQWTADVRAVDGDLSPRAWGASALAEGFRALKTGDVSGAREWAAKLRAKADAKGDEETSLPIAALELEGLLQLEDGQPDAAVATLRQAVQFEERTPFGYGPPIPAKPAPELLGEILLATDQADDAVKAFQASLERTPRRALSLLGLRKAATAAGDQEAAEHANSELRDLASRR